MMPMVSTFVNTYRIKDAYKELLQDLLNNRDYVCGEVFDGPAFGGAGEGVNQLSMGR